MAKQIITVGIKLTSSTQSFRILHVWKTEDALIVASKLNRDHSLGIYGACYASARAEIDDIDQPLPVKHYAIGVNEKNIVGLPNHDRPILIDRETDIPAHEREVIVYESKLSDSEERIITITNMANEFATASLHFLDPEKDEVIRASYNDAAFIRNAIAKDVHDFREQVILLSSYVKHDNVISAARNGVLNDEEVKAALMKFHLTPEDGARLVQFNKAYRADLKAKADKIISAHAEENNRRHNIQSLHDDNAIFSYKNLTRFGLFAAGGIAVAALAVANAVLTPNNKM